MATPESQGPFQFDLDPPNTCWVSPRHILVPLEKLSPALNNAYQWLLREAGVDVECNVAQACIEGVARVGSSACSFVLAAYRLNSFECYLEFRTVRGCVYILDNLWHRLKWELDREVHLKGNLEVMPKGNPYEPPSTYQISLHAQDVTVLCGLAQSHCRDVMLAGVQNLAAAASLSDANAKVILNTWPDALQWALATLPLVNPALPETLHALCAFAHAVAPHDLNPRETILKFRGELTRIAQTKQTVQLRAAQRYCADLLSALD